MMTERQITAANAYDLPLRRLYETAFPREEQISYDDLVRLTAQMPLDFTAYYDDGTLVGLTIVYPRPSANWFWYFAVVPELRGRGIGQRILSRLLERYAERPNLLDMESPAQPCDNAEQRHRRHAFYLRNGFRDTGVGRTFEGIDYTIMVTGDMTFTPDDYDDLLRELRAHWDAMPEAEDTNAESSRP